MTGLEFFRDETGFWRWRVRATNGRIVADSGEGYRDRADCEHGARLAGAMLVTPTVDPSDDEPDAEE